MSKKNIKDLTLTGKLDWVGYWELTSHYTSKNYIQYNLSDILKDFIDREITIEIKAIKSSEPLENISQKLSL